MDGDDAVDRKLDTGPTHRLAAHRAKSMTEGSGPRPLRRARGRRVTPSGGSTQSATTQPATRRPCRTMRTRLPMRRRSARPSSDQAFGTR